MNAPHDADTETLPPAAHPRRVLRMRAGALAGVEDLVVDEVPVALV
jgi:FdhD protein